MIEEENFYLRFLLQSPQKGITRKPKIESIDFGNLQFYWDVLNDIITNKIQNKLEIHNMEIENSISLFDFQS